MPVNGNRSLFGAKSDDRVAISGKEFLTVSFLPPLFEQLEIQYDFTFYAQEIRLGLQIRLDLRDLIFVIAKPCLKAV